MNVALLAFVILAFGNINLQAQDGEKTQERFSYSYGVLLGDNLKNFGLDFKDVNMEELVAGIKAIMSNQDLKIDKQTAQQEVNNKLQALQQVKSNEQLVKNDAFMAANAKKEGMKITASGIQYEVLTKGTGTVFPTPKDKVTTHYHGTLIDGTVFDSSVERGKPIDFPVTGVIKGWQEMLQLMKVGDKLRVYIPPHLAYGSRDQNKIPGNSVLIFEMELLGIN